MPLTWAFYIGGYLIGLVVFTIAARRQGWKPGPTAAVMFAAIVGGLSGAHFVQWLVTGSSGRTVLGALLGGGIAVWSVMRLFRLGPFPGDMLALAVCAGEALGRWSCFYSGCCYGKPTAVPWAVWQHDTFRHPTQIYMSLTNVGILIILVVYLRTRPPQNGVFYLQVALYSFARFVIEFFRDSHPAALGLSSAQWLCLAAMIVFAMRLYRLVAIVPHVLTANHSREGSNEICAQTLSL